MNQRYIDYAQYNIWANNRLIIDISKLDDRLLQQRLVGSFPTIQATILHIWYAETGWLSRLQGQSWEVSNVVNFSGNITALITAWQATSTSFLNFVEIADLETKVEFEHKGEKFSIPAREIAQTVFNHGSFHRGQVVMFMRQLGITEITQTDYIEWVREKVRSEVNENKHFYC